MTRDDFIKTYLEGATFAPPGVLVYDLVGKIYDCRKTQYELYDKIRFMDDIARDTEWTMNCRSCGQAFEPDCELSEMFGAEVYCGKSDRCCP